MNNPLPYRHSLLLLLLTSSVTSLSCGRTNSGGRPSVEAKQSVRVADGSPRLQHERGWEEAYNKGIDLRNQGKVAEASYYFSNALGASPGNVKVIEAYCTTMMTLGKSEQPSEGLAYDLSVLQVLEGFLLSQVPLVTFDEVGTVLDLLADVRGRISGSQATAPTREDYESLLAAITDGTYSLPKTSEDLAAAMETLSDLKEYTAKRPKDGSEHVMSQQIDDLASQAQSQLDFLSLSAVLTTQKESTRDACTTSATIAEYKLQECEQILRQMVARYAVTHPEQVSQELKSLRDLARSVVEAKSEESWKAIISQLDSIKSERGAIGTSPDGDQRGVYQKKLDNIQQEASLLQNALPGLVGGSLELAVTRMNSLKEEARELSTNQSREYNAWAMERIRACLNKGGEGVGVFANGAEGRKTIGRALISELGPIDRRHLTTEVSRCLDEVMGKYLAPNQLNPVKKGSDLEEEGTILFTLNGMHQVRKRQLSDF